MKKVNVLLCCGVMVGLFSIPSSPRAEPADAPNIAGGENMPWNRGVSSDTRAAARDVFQEGNRLFKIPLFSRAVEKYSEAIEKWKHPAFYFNLALAEINLGQYLAARESLELALKYGPDPLRVDRFDEAMKQLVEVQRHLGRIRVSCSTPGAEVTLDAATLFTGPDQRDVWVAAGAHAITAKRSTYATQARRVAVTPGAHEAVELSLHKLIEERPWSTWKPWAVFGSGATIAGAAAGLHALSAHDFSTYDSGFLELSCSPTGCTEQQIKEENRRLPARLSRARLEQKIAVGGYIAGGAVMAVGVVLLYLNRPHLMEREDARPSTTGIAMIPMVSDDMVGILMTVNR